jgi:hypothetical protein
MSWIKTAKVGDKVQCFKTDDTVPDDVVLAEVPQVPHIGRVYTIRAITVGMMDDICLKFDEIADQRIEVEWRGKIYFGDVMFPAKNFRPLQSRPVSIQCFNFALNGLDMVKEDT